MSTFLNQIPTGLLTILILITNVAFAWESNKTLKNDKKHPIKYLKWSYVAFSCLLLLCRFAIDYIGQAGALVIVSWIMGVILVAFILSIIFVYYLCVKKGYVSIQLQKENAQKFKYVGILFVIFVFLVGVALLIN